MKIVHLSDLHFGTEEDAVVQTLRAAIEEKEPGLIVVSGDFTQVGSAGEFRAARDFLNSLSAPVFCVPGNHDIPRYNLRERLVDPYKRYRTYICEELNPVFGNDDILIAGLNSARRMLPHWNWANGAVSGAQRQSLERLFDAQEERWTIGVLHHPLHKVEEMPLDVTVFGRKAALQQIHALKIDLVLTGHVHHASVATRGDETHQTLFLSASTALSSRRRGQQNGFNVITLDGLAMHIETHVLQDGGFSRITSYEHKRSG